MKEWTPSDAADEADDKLRREGKYVDPREDDNTREGIFRSHNCWKCRDGRLPCVQDNTNLCDYPRARND